ncbi:HK97 gp10 family phage protein [Streptomyces sp. ActVer]|uniref:HK97 gp10 family phage protein n=1 Tax=Streptomyces sp. ActVer TaxID=3014558 RepID=UPI0022B31A40|nr:HK97 gp10 family phage protein [Streptomyces sp. ActVer]MCZ4506922.1 HK97 gp10 family phage protein [Streptomyces sp. ActVer]
MATFVDIDVDIDEEAIQFELPLTDEVQDDMKARMDRVVVVGKATAPVLTGAYQESIHRLEEVDDDGTNHVDAAVDYAYFVEHGTRQTDRNGRSIHRPHYTLSHALDAAGGDH